MSLRSFRAYQALILAGLGIYLISKVMDGRILFYINRRFVILVLLAGLGFIFLAQLVFRERQRLTTSVDEEASAHQHAHQENQSGQGWMLWLVAVPLIVGMLAPERSLSGSAVQMRGINTSSSLAIRGAATRALDIPSTQRSVLDWIRAASEEKDGARIEGQAADITGFVYHDPRLEKTQFLVGRFSIACCVADAVAVGLVVTWPESATILDNRWVRVRGTIHMVDFDGAQLPGIRADQVEYIPEPEQPYIFP
jgi:putative membrane protein